MCPNSSSPTLFGFAELIRRLAVWLELADLLWQLLDSATSMSSPFTFGGSPFWSWFADFTFFFFISAHIMSSPFAFGGSPFLTLFALSGLSPKVRFG